ncbi:branched-chain amino acid ABC transporter permease [Endozoicomonas sp. OPT23]|uniref:ABC transporter permease n=1 Tax=Endozoicomonas sp. OPT23 TaxID=2072845 RepID=UPI00129AB788|nr:ABC transporter permease [Endozoicomonas sp. OPT23]MRI31508.1 branched-chain amino acid ABC transporter permease [Endozoicomonas sp. OPT23]
MTSLLQRRETQLFLILLLMLVFIGIRAPVFFSAQSMDTLLTDLAILAMVASVQMLAIMTRGIDLSVAANIALTGMVTAMLSSEFPAMPVWQTVMTALGLGLMLGTVNAVLIANVGIPPIVVTLGTMSIYRGMVFVVSDGNWVNAHELAEQYLGFPIDRFLTLTNIVWISVVLLALLHLFLSRHRHGRELYGLGGNPEAAKYVGINEKQKLYIVYCLTGMVSGLCGYLWVARYAVAYTEVALGFELSTVAACVIGGVSMAGGIGTVLGTVLGSAFLVLIFNALPVINVSPFWQMAISGSVILIAVILNSINDRPQMKVILKKAQLATAKGAA